MASPLVSEADGTVKEFSDVRDVKRVLTGSACRYIRQTSCRARAEPPSLISDDEMSIPVPDDERLMVRSNRTPRLGDDLRMIDRSVTSAVYEFANPVLPHVRAVLSSYPPVIG